MHARKVKRETKDGVEVVHWCRAHGMVLEDLGKVYGWRRDGARTVDGGEVIRYVREELVDCTARNKPIVIEGRVIGGEEIIKEEKIDIDGSP